MDLTATLGVDEMRVRTQTGRRGLAKSRMVQIKSKEILLMNLVNSRTLCKLNLLRHANPSIMSDASHNTARVTEFGLS